MDRQTDRPTYKIRSNFSNSGSLNFFPLDERDDRNLEISLKVNLLDETWNANLLNSSHDDFNELQGKIENNVSSDHIFC